MPREGCLKKIVYPRAWSLGWGHQGRVRWGGVERAAILTTVSDQSQLMHGRKAMSKQNHAQLTTGLGPSAGHQRQTELWSTGSLKKRCSLPWHLSVGCYSRLWTTPKMGAQAHVKEGQWCLWKVWVPSDDMEIEIWTLKQEGIQRKQLRNLWPKTQHPQERQSFFEQRKVLLVIRLATR